MPLCSQADVEALRQMDITAEPDPTITALIRHAEGILEGVTGRRFGAVTDVEISSGSLVQTDGMIWLEVYPLTAVAIENSDSDPYTVDLHYSWTADGRIRRLGAGGSSAFTWQYEPWRTPEWPIGTVIRYSGGVTDPDDAPQDLRTLCAEVAADLMDRGFRGPGAPNQEALGSWSGSWSPRVGNLSDQQTRIARRYIRNRGQMVTY